MGVQKALRRKAAARRRRRVFFSVIVVALLAGGAYLFLRDADTGTPTATDETEDAPRDVSEGEILEESPGIFFLDGNTLKSIDPGQDAPEVVREGVNLGSNGPDDASFATWLAFLTPVEPRIHIYEQGNDDLEVIPGTTPVWNESGTRLAYKRPFLAGTPCDDQKCKGEEQVFVLDTKTGKSEAVLERGRWEIVGWGGDTLVVGDRKQEEEVLLVSPDGESRTLEVPWEGVESLSPDGKWMLYGPDSGPELLQIGDEVEEAWLLGGEDDTITNVDWTADSSTAAVVAATDTFPTRLFTLDTGSPSLEPFSEDEVSGKIYWTQDERGIVVSRINRDAAMFEGAYCPVRAPNSCVVLLEWKSATRVLGLKERS